MADTYGEESGSDQEELVNISTSDIDEDGTDIDEMQFTFCKANNPGNNDSTDSQYKENKSKLSLFGVGFSLLGSAFLLLIILPLYNQQLALGGDEYNAYGAILYVSSIVTLLFIAVAGLADWIWKWDVRFYELPIPGRRLFTISTCCGLAGTLCTISSYQRVPCHLQDPLKGAALVYSLVFYFFFCRKVMGLQRIFSATTAVVGLFISVDYGLCDEFRCRGADINTKTAASVGWQGRAVWTLFYVAGIALWTLHLSLLEGHVVTVGISNPSIPPANLLTTVSRIVSNSDPLLPETPVLSPPKHKPKPLHLAAWIHGIGFFIIMSLGWIDIIPGSGQIKSFPDFITNTRNSFLCHFSIQHEVPDIKNHQDTLEFLSNLIPNSILYNKTVQKLRNRRDTTNSHNNLKYFHTRINSHRYDDVMENTVKNLTKSDVHQNENKTHSYKINTEKHFQKMKSHNSRVKHKKMMTENLNNQTPIKISHLVLKTNRTGDCDQVKKYAWLFIIVYMVFAVCLLKFIIVSESAVFTIAVVTGALTLVGIFWSLFELTTKNYLATIIWSPEITGELICSLLGTPIVFLGLGLLCRAHFYETNTAATSSTQRGIYSSLTSRIA